MTLPPKVLTSVPVPGTKLVIPARSRDLTTCGKGRNDAERLAGTSARNCQRGNLPTDCLAETIGDELVNIEGTVLN